MHQLDSSLDGSINEERLERIRKRLDVIRQYCISAQSRLSDLEAAEPYAIHSNKSNSATNTKLIECKGECTTFTVKPPRPCSLHASTSAANSLPTPVCQIREIIFPIHWLQLVLQIDTHSTEERPRVSVHSLAPNTPSTYSETALSITYLPNDANFQKALSIVADYHRSPNATVPQLLSMLRAQSASKIP